MTKKQVRISEKALLLAKQQLMINEEANATPDELITMLIMQNQESRQNAQIILDYMGDEFSQRINGQNKSRLTFKNSHFSENGGVLGISRLLVSLDRKPTSVGMSDILKEIKDLRSENSFEHRLQNNRFNTSFLSLKLMISNILTHVLPKSTKPKDAIARITLSEESNTVMNGVDAYALTEIKRQSKDKDKKRSNNYDD